MHFPVDLSLYLVADWDWSKRLKSIQTLRNCWGKISMVPRRKTGGFAVVRRVCKGSTMPGQAPDIRGLWAGNRGRMSGEAAVHFWIYAAACCYCMALMSAGRIVRPRKGVGPSSFLVSRPQTRDLLLRERKSNLRH